MWEMVVGVSRITPLLSELELEPGGGSTGHQGTNLPTTGLSCFPIRHRFNIHIKYSYYEDSAANDSYCTNPQLPEDKLCALELLLKCKLWKVTRSKCTSSMRDSAAAVSVVVRYRANTWEWPFPSMPISR